MIAKSNAHNENEDCRDGWIKQHPEIKEQERKIKQAEQSLWSLESIKSPEEYCEKIKNLNKKIVEEKMKLRSLEARLTREFNEEMNISDE